MQRYVIFTSTDYDDQGRPAGVYGVYAVPPCFSPNPAFLQRAQLVDVDVHLSDEVMDGADFPDWAHEGGQRMWQLLSAASTASPN